MLSRVEACRCISAAEHLFYVYLLIDQCGQPFYVGKGTQWRCFAHEKESLNPENNTEKHRLIRKMLDSEIEVRYQFAGFFPTDDEAHDEERRLIRLFGRRNQGSGILCNLTDGGEGHSRDYPPEPFQRNSDGIPIGKVIEYPSTEQLKPPLFWTGDLSDFSWIQEDRNLIQSQDVELNKSRLVMPLIAFWQYAGWTIQVFWEQTSVFDPAEIDLKGLAECVHFRFFDNTNLLIEDSIRATAHSIITPGRLVALVLRALAGGENTKIVSANSLNRVCKQCARVDLTKRLQAWCFHQQHWLLKFANDLEDCSPPPPPIKVFNDKLPDKFLLIKPDGEITNNLEEFHKLLRLAWVAFIQHGLGEKQFAQLNQLDLRGLVMYMWSGLAPIDGTFIAYSYSCPTIKVNLNEAKLTRMQLINEWNKEFPSMPLPIGSSREGPAFMEREIRAIVRTIVDLHNNQLEVLPRRGADK
ncbi:MAG: GIY-YIG nuclease family protein [Pirellulales bacterium]|nr:GIY-YIG nuclease family protein [Pirellulales bacterium]